MNFTRFGDRQDADDLARHDVMSSVASTNAARFGASDDGTLEAQFKKERARREALQTARRDMDAPVLRGTCDSMCPPFEALERTFRNEADFFERSDMSNDRSKYVKAYKRSAAGDGALLVEDLRTLPALQATWRHLLSLVDQHGIASTHNFVWNRSRAVRKDLMAQTLYSPDALVLYQQIVRYHLYVLQQLSGAENFERFQEIEQLNNALVSVFDCYKELNMDPQAAPASCVEFVAYARLLWNLQTRPRKEVIALCQVFRRRPAIRQSTALLKILKAIETDASTGDADFRIAAVQSYFAWMASPHTPYLLAVAGSFYLDRVRFWTLQSFARAGFQSSGGLVPTTLSMAELTELLHFRDVDECRDFVDICGLDIAPVDTVAFGRKTSSGALQLEDVVFGTEGDSWKIPEKTKKSLRFLDSKLPQHSVALLVQQDGFEEVAAYSVQRTAFTSTVSSPATLGGAPVAATLAPRLLSSARSRRTSAAQDGPVGITTTVALPKPFALVAFKGSPKSLSSLPGSPMQLSSPVFPKASSESQDLLPSLAPRSTLQSVAQAVGLQTGLGFSGPNNFLPPDRPLPAAAADVHQKRKRSASSYDMGVLEDARVEARARPRVSSAVVASVCTDILGECLVHAGRQVVGQAVHVWQQSSRMRRAHDEGIVRQCLQRWRCLLRQHIPMVSCPLRELVPPYARVLYDGLLFRVYQALLLGIAERLQTGLQRLLAWNGDGNWQDICFGSVACWNNVIRLVQHGENVLAARLHRQPLAMFTDLLIDDTALLGGNTNELGNRLNVYLNALPLTVEQYQYVRALVSAADSGRSGLFAASNKSLCEALVVLVAFLMERLDTRIAGLSEAIYVSSRQLSALKVDIETLNWQYHAELAAFLAQLTAALTQQAARPTEEQFTLVKPQGLPDTVVFVSAADEAAYSAIAKKHNLRVISFADGV